MSYIIPKRVLDEMGVKGPEALRRLNKATSDRRHGGRIETMSGKSAEQQARDLLEQCGVEDAQSFSAGEVVALANLIAKANTYRRQLAAIKERCVGFTPDPSVVDEILAIIGENPPA